MYIYFSLALSSTSFSATGFGSLVIILQNEYAMNMKVIIGFCSYAYMYAFVSNL